MLKPLDFRYHVPQAKALAAREPWRIRGNGEIGEKSNAG